MYDKNKILLLWILAVVLAQTTGCRDALGEVLEGTVEKDAELQRLNRPAGIPGAGVVGQPSAFRIARPTYSGGAQSLFNSEAFAPPLSGRAPSNAFSGVVQAGQFGIPPARNFDIGADASSRELVLAWDRWHQQLSCVIYQRWTQRADAPGYATIRVTVTRDRRIRADILTSRGNGDFLAGIMDAIEGLNGNPGLTFPTGSERQAVSYEADYIAGHNVTPGYSWVHNDYEVIHQQY